MAFYNSANFSAYQRECKIMTEIVTNNEKEYIVSYATKAGSFDTLDKNFWKRHRFCFACQNLERQKRRTASDSNLFSDVKSEEIQIKGKAAIQRGNGSYSLVLFLEELEKFGLTTAVFDLN